MPARRVPVAEQEAEIARLDALGRDRALTRVESDRLYLLLSRQRERRSRLGDQLRKIRLKLATYEARANA